MATQYGESVAAAETVELISADKVEGTSVYNRQGENLGSVYRVMIDKMSGRVVYAVMSFGGFLGMGERYHPLPWSMLTYDPNKGGYVVDLDRDLLEAAPAYGASDMPDWTDPTWGRSLHDYYGARGYWE
jgi:sporulation protein YlmC with PRC-barrel domain